MAIQSLTPPQDITWNRIAYSRDMIDTNFGDLKFPPKWRSSLAVHYFIVPEEETVDAYPNSRIVYLRLSCSITGWNPNEELQNARKSAEQSGALDDLQKSIWETVLADGWSNVYWPCLGAIMQIAVYPPRNSTIGPDDYPEIMDFQPKKRELYETVTEGQEVLSGSSEKLSIGKSNSSTLSVSASAGFSVGGLGASASIGHTESTIENRDTDTSREDRETKSHSTSFSQMYQLFNGYHLGTNRALFVVAPRPHTVSDSEQTEFNLIDGQRKLEGIQDVFLVVHLPKKLNGFCIQASIDTGHTVMVSNIMARENPTQPNGRPGDENGHGQPPPPPPPPPDETYTELVVTRRMVQNCGSFDDNGNFVITGVPDLPPKKPPVVWEDPILQPKTNADLLRVSGSSDNSKKIKAELANKMNITQRRIIKSMISGFSAGNFEPIEFTKSRTYRRSVMSSSQYLNIPISELVRLNYLSQEEAASLARDRIITAGDIFKEDIGQSRNPNIQKLRLKIIKKFGI